MSVGPDVTARDVVEYIARGQIKTLACYDVVPSLSIGQIYKTADWYDKTLKFHLGVQSSLLSGLRIISPYPSTSSPLMIAR